MREPGNALDEIGCANFASDSSRSIKNSTEPAPSQRLGETSPRSFYSFAILAGWGYSQESKVKPEHYGP
jgi:hypothetical protein